jgi:hypothetical protein
VTTRTTQRNVTHHVILTCVGNRPATSAIATHGRLQICHFGIWKVGKGDVSRQRRMSHAHLGLDMSMRQCSCNEPHPIATNALQRATPTEQCAVTCQRFKRATNLSIQPPSAYPLTHRPGLQHCLKQCRLASRSPLFVPRYVQVLIRPTLGILPHRQPVSYTHIDSFRQSQSPARRSSPFHSCGKWSSPRSTGHPRRVIGIHTGRRMR